MAYRLTIAGALGVVSILTLGCDAPGFKSKAKSPTSTATPPVGQTHTTSAPVATQGSAAEAIAQIPSVLTPGLTISNAIAQACAIAPNAAGDAPRASFGFDSAALEEADRKMLAEVAKCLTDGALRGKRVVLVGRADARGEQEYNLTLGESRADAVHRYLVDLGVGKERLRPTSRGELDATGTTEEGWARDRRVDVELDP